MAGVGPSTSSCFAATSSCFFKIRSWSRNLTPVNSKGLLCFKIHHGVPHISLLTGDGVSLCVFMYETSTNITEISRSFCKDHNFQNMWTFGKRLCNKQERKMGGFLLIYIYGRKYMPWIIRSCWRSNSTYFWHKGLFPCIVNGVFFSHKCINFYKHICQCLLCIMSWLLQCTLCGASLERGPRSSIGAAYSS